MNVKLLRLWRTRNWKLSSIDLWKALSRRSLEWRVDNCLIQADLRSLKAVSISSLKGKLPSHLASAPSFRERQTRACAQVRLSILLIGLIWILTSTAKTWILISQKKKIYLVFKWSELLKRDTVQRQFDLKHCKCNLINSWWSLISHTLKRQNWRTAFIKRVIIYFFTQLYV